MVSRCGETPSSVRVECPDCGADAQISLQYTDGSTNDYEGVCDARLEDGDLCGVALMLTANLPEGTTTEDGS